MKRAIKVTADSDIPFLKGLIEPFAEIEYLKGSEITRERIMGSDALFIRTRTKCNSELLQGSNVRFIASATIGSDHVDVEWCKEAGIHFSNASGCNAWGVVQYVITSIFYVFDKRGESPEGKTLGVVGAGNVGERLASLAERVGFKVLRCDPPLKSLIQNDPGYFANNIEGPDRSHLSERDFYPLSYLLEHSDIVSVHVPLTAMTWDMADDRFFSAMKSGAMFINSSRGEVVNEKALIKYSGALSGIVIDVWRNEPDINTELMKITDIATPHIAGYSIEGKINATRMTVNSFGDYFKIRELSDLIIDYPPGRELLFKPSSDSEPFVNLSNLIFSLYDIGEDSKILKESPDIFETIRNGYSYREEYSEEVKGMFDSIIKNEYV